MNIYKYFSIPYDYCIQQAKRIVLRNISPETLMLSVEYTWYLINTPLVKWIRQTFFTKRHRKTDLRQEPVLDIECDRSWISVSELYDEKAGFKIRDCFRTPSIKKIYELHETYYQPAHTYLDAQISHKVLKQDSDSELDSIPLRDSDEIRQEIRKKLFETQHHTNGKLFLYQFVNQEKLVKMVSITPYGFHLNIHEPSVVSKVKFLDIQYHHPDMSEPLILELSKEYYYIGNQLFSNAFVYRMLLYQPFPFVFDEHYMLELMDNDLEIMTLKSTEYLVLEDTSYRVV
jgi:hypothetical protein